MSDYISRQDALTKARPEYLNPQQQKLASYNQGWNDAVDEFYDGIKALPSADRPTGRWVNRKGRSVAECDQCGRIGRRYMNYCPHCGAKMEDE